MTTPTNLESQLQDRIQTYLERTRLTRERARVVTLTSDASDRRYFRVIRRRGTLVLAVYGEPFDYAALPFVNVAMLLRQMPVPTPAIVGHQDDLGILVLEDLGDLTLQAHVGAAPREEHAALYREAVGLIAVLQRRGAELASPAYLPYTLAFDTAKFVWELHFFVQHFLEGYRGAVISDAERAALDEEFARLAGELSAEPRVLCHRDFHSRNLMLHDDRLYVIDFQDARMGPNTYDLASLLRDSYVDLAEEDVAALIAHFRELAECREDEAAFRGRFDTMALQRNLKALGTFGYQTAARQNPVYIQYIPRALRYVRDNLARHPRWARLHELLARHLEELQ